MYKTYLILFFIIILSIIYIFWTKESFIDQIDTENIYYTNYSSSKIHPESDPNVDFNIDLLNRPCIYSLDLNECWSNPKCQVLNNLCIEKFVSKSR